MRNEVSLGALKISGIFLGIWKAHLYVSDLVHDQKRHYSPKLSFLWWTFRLSENSKWKIRQSGKLHGSTYLNIQKVPARLIYNKWLRNLLTDYLLTTKLIEFETSIDIHENYRISSEKSWNKQLLKQTTIKQT